MKLERLSELWPTYWCSPDRLWPAKLRDRPQLLARMPLLLLSELTCPALAASQPPSAAAAQKLPLRLWVMLKLWEREARGEALERGGRKKLDRDPLAMEVQRSSMRLSTLEPV